MSEDLILLRDYQSEYTFYKGTAFYYAIRHCSGSAQLTLPQSFELGGTYIFGNFETISSADLYLKLTRFLTVSSPNLGFLWIENPDMGISQWKCHAISCATKNATVWCLGNYSELKFGAYRLMLSGDMEITCQQDQMIFATPTGILNGYLFRLAQINGLSTQSAVILNFSSSTVGTLNFNIILNGNGEVDVFKKMDACIKYSAPLSDEVEGAWKQGFVGVVSSPVLQSIKSLNMAVFLNPIGLCDSTKTYLTLFDETSDNYFDSVMINVNGHAQRIQVGSDAHLVFEIVPRYICFDKKNNTYSGESVYYLGFSGSYYMENAESHLLCGLSGTEFMDLSSVDNREIKFMPNQNAFFSEKSHQNLSTTSWISFPENTKYFCQPEIAPMYSENDQNVLRILEIPTTRLDDNTHAVPMVFYKESQISFLDSHRVEEIEWRIYETRFQLITNNVVQKAPQMKSFQDDPCQKTVTPQGLMAGVIPSSGSYDWFGIAQTNGIQGLPNIRFCQVSESLRMEFQNSKLFIYKDNQATFMKEAQPSSDFKVWIDDWCFLLSPENWKVNDKEKNTAFIMKYVKGKSIKELLTGKPIFEASLKLAYDNRGVVLPQYKNFVELVQDPNFQGIVFLNVMLSITEIPKEVAFLLKEVKPEDFYAHHVILEGNKVNQGTDGDLIMQQSTIQALVDYKDNQQIVYNEDMPNYAFSTVEMTLSVENSRISYFSSTSEILINQLYGADCVKSNSTSGNCMILDGRSQKKEQAVEYVYTLREIAAYGLKNSPIFGVQIQKVLLSVDVGSGKNGRLTFCGQMCFDSIPNCDLLSYTDLQFSSLQLVIPDVGNLYMEYGNLVVNLSGSTMRDQSFGARFACDLENIIYETDKMPEDIGFQTITAPVDQSKLQKPWTAQIWNLSLGSLGNLSNSGEVTIKFIIAWSIGKKGPEYYVGVALPSLAKGLDLQGIIKLGFQSVELKLTQQNGVNQFMLRLHNYTLRLLCLAIPPGSNDLFIFADGKKLGWYAAYAGEES